MTATVPLVADSASNTPLPKDNPPPTPSDSDLALRGAASVYAYVLLRLERDATGLRWQTLTYSNEPLYEAGIWNGTAGIALFLAEYARVTRDPAAAALAAEALDWSERTLDQTPAPPSPPAPPAPPGLANSLGLGWSGLGYAWLSLALAQTTSTTRFPTSSRTSGLFPAIPNRTSGPQPKSFLLRAAACAARLDPPARESPASYLWGLAGQGAFLLRLGRATGDGSHLCAATSCAEAILAGPLSAVLALGPDQPPPERVAGGFAPGLAGVAYFLAELYGATHEPRWHAASRALLDLLLHHAQRSIDGSPDSSLPQSTASDVAPLQSAEAAIPRSLTWPVVLGAVAPPRFQWCTGTAGIGLALARAAVLLHEPRYLEAACAAGCATYAAGDARENPCLCHGLTGNAELLVELFKVTGDAVWLERALDFARRIWSYRLETPAGDVWPADEPGLEAVNLSTGAAGIGRVFLRLVNPGALPIPLGACDP